MSSGKARHLDIEPEDLIFRPRDSSSDPTFLAGLVLRNPKDTCVGFKFKTNQPSRYSVKPFLGVIQPKASVEVTGKRFQEFLNASSYNGNSRPLQHLY